MISHDLAMMICYTAAPNKAEVNALNDYWALSSEPHKTFSFTTSELTQKYKFEDIKPINTLIQNSSFYFSHPSLFCTKCGDVVAFRNRKDFMGRLRGKRSTVCAPCRDNERDKMIEESLSILRPYKESLLFDSFSIESLDFIETFSLLALCIECKGPGTFLSYSLERVCITGSEPIDQRIIRSLIAKGALVDTGDIPKHVKEASDFIGFQFRQAYILGKDLRLEKSKSSYLIKQGIYMGSPSEDTILTRENIADLLYERLLNHVFSIKDVSKIETLIKDIQLNKLFRLVWEIADEFKLVVSNTHSLWSTIEHLALKYSPLSAHGAFMTTAKEAEKEIRQRRVPKRLVKNYFTRSLMEYIDNAENEGHELPATFALPWAEEASPFESVFSKMYLRVPGDSNWNRLSAREITELWLKNVQITDTQGRDTWTPE